MNKHVTHVHRRHRHRQVQRHFFKLLYCLLLFLSHPAHNTNANGMLHFVLMNKKSLVFYE